MASNGFRESCENCHNRQLHTANQQEKPHVLQKKTCGFSYTISSNRPFLVKNQKVKRTPASTLHLVVISAAKFLVKVP